ELAADCAVQEHGPRHLRLAAQRQVAQASCAAALIPRQRKPARHADADGYVKEGALPRVLDVDHYGERGLPRRVDACRGGNAQRERTAHDRDAAQAVLGYVLTALTGLKDRRIPIERHGAVELVEFAQAGKVTPRYEGKVPHTVNRKSTRLNSSHVKTSYAVFC